MASFESQGTTFAIGDGASPEVFSVVGEVTSIAGPSGQASVIDVSTLASTRREKIMGLPDEGQIQVSMNLDPGDTGGQVAMRTARDTREQTNFQITLTDSPATVLEFAGYVLSFNISVGVDQVITAEATVEVTGAVTWS